MSTRPIRRSAAVVAAVVLAVASCSKEPAEEAAKEAGWTPPRIVRFEGSEGCFNYSRSYMAWAVKAEKQATAAVLAREGDLLAFEKGGAFPYAPADGDVLTVTVEGESDLTLGGRPVCVGLGKEKAERWEWVKNAPMTELAHVRFLNIPDVVAPKRVPLLEKLAKACPGAGLALDDAEAARQVLPLFKPRMLLGAEFLFEPDAEGLLVHLAEVEFLGVEVGKEVKGLGIVSRLPRLRTLMLLDWDPEQTGPLPKEGCTALRSLIVGSEHVTDLTAVSHLAELRELHLARCAKLADVGALARLPKLRALTLTGCKKLTDLSPLGALPELAWLALPPETSQEQLAAVAAQNGGVEVLELIGCEKVTDLGPVAGMAKLWGLVLIKTPAPREPLRQMKTLRYLALEADVFEKSADEVAALEKDLPGCTIVAGEGMCLGSGWILLLVPVAALAWFLGLACLLPERGARPTPNRG